MSPRDKNERSSSPESINSYDSVEKHMRIRDIGKAREYESSEDGCLKEAVVF